MPEEHVIQFRRTFDPPGTASRSGLADGTEIVRLSIELRRAERFSHAQGFVAMAVLRRAERFSHAQGFVAMADDLLRQARDEVSRIRAAWEAAVDTRL